MRMIRLPGPVPIAVLAILLAGLVASTPAEAAPTLLQHYQFNGDFTSSTSGGITAVDLSTGTAVSTTGGIQGGAAYFDGADDLLLIEGQNILSAGEVTFAFWEKADNLGTEISKGYFLSDAAANPLDNLYLRRYPSPVSGVGDVSAPNGKVAVNHFAQFAPQELTTEVWHQHTITYTDSGVGYWWVDGQLSTLTPTGDLFAGLATVNPSSDYDRAGIVLGNRLIGGREYQGYLDEVQIYQGSAHTGMAQYLYSNPGATLDTYDDVAYPDTGIAVAPGVRPTNAAVRRWKFDGNLQEDGGTAHGSAIGNATAGTNNGVYAGSGAVSFDGVDDAVTIDADVISTNKYSISLWEKAVSGNTGYLFADETWRNLLVRRYTSDNVAGKYDIWAGGVDAFQFIDSETEAPATYDEWHHVVVAVDGEWGNLRTYVDGKLAMTVSSVNGQYTANMNIESEWGNGDGFHELLGNLLYLGNRNDLGRDFSGLLDDLQIYNWNLSEADVQLLYDNPGLTLMQVPEPGSLALLLTAVISLLLIRRQ